MSPPWEVAQKENRRELVLHGSAISKLLEDSDGELPVLIWELQQLNFLEISSVGLNSISQAISNLKNLTRLCLRDNSLSTLPAEMNQLVNLTFLDASGNVLTNVDQSIIDSWKSMTNLNLSGNKLVTLPSLNKLCNLQYLNVANNKLKSLPDGLSMAQNLLQLEAQCNELELLPEEISKLGHLKLLNVHTNKLIRFPVEIWNCSKLKDLRANGNVFTDKRLRKMTEDSKTSSAAIFDYLRKQSGAQGKGKGKGKGRSRCSSSRGDMEEVEGAGDSTSFRKIIEIHRPAEDGLTVQVTSEAINQRPYLVCCVVRGIEFGTLCKSFIKYQESLHGTVCERRLKAAIGTHDLRSVVSPVELVTGNSKDILITPLGSTNEESAWRFLNRMRQKAEEERRRLKRNTVTGVNKYLWLVKDESTMAYMKGGDGLVISLPPLTNCNQTALSDETREIFLEVHGSDRLDLCKSVMDKLVVWLTDNCSGEQNTLHVEQVRVINSDSGQLRVLYPSVMDLQAVSDGILVRRPT